MTRAQHFATQDAAPIAVLPALAEPDSASEINHRVANSLQLLAAMVSVEARRIVDPAALAAFEMTLRRIGAIANVHRHLYRASAAASVDLGAYLEELSAALEQGFGDARAGRRILVAAESVTVSPEDATSIGIIVSELVGNACKYAYAPGEPGDIRILLRTLPFGGYRLDVSDRGCGIKGALPQGTGLGGRLIAMMANRLGAATAWNDAPRGTHFTLHLAKL
jgi:two-component sensor histidine kinase